LRRSTVRELGRGWSREQGGAAIARLKKETIMWDREVSEGGKRKARRPLASKRG
jgi:hypothetical protein